MPSSKLSRHSYHHGDLANALTGAALELARAGGPEAVVLREAARQIGVSATAAYRHFNSREDLIHAVKDCALTELAERMQQELEATAAADDTVEALAARMRALGHGYISFALEKPGLFRTAFHHSEPMTGRQGMDPLETAPFQMLMRILDRLVELGAIDPQRRPYLGMFAWATAHGVADLLLDGPLRNFPPEVQRAAVQHALDATVAGILAR
ncbi:TetR/AcrR family transcriptional regulator [Dactylosporangium vinaceum]|uniref:TetR/AcrR family transcriptional regulator n=1 Tax=Dactylosporangium vinaceum TaxID=53362 RepID=A0ABV5M3Y5_9ACTN|nr:TetR/AcrR family transcriptional regulator [Dactylosporangium vinaceum]UAB93530.1 TetR/AcrR family transcriptional regulator [Dactylosporangium vinaceum]